MGRIIHRKKVGVGKLDLKERKECMIKQMDGVIIMNSVKRNRSSLEGAISWNVG